MGTKKRYELTGQKFGRLLVLGKFDSPKRGQHWECVCDCGETVIDVTAHLVSGSTQSCGCLGTERRKAANDKKKANAMSREERLERRKIWNRRYKERHPEKCKQIQDESNKKRKDVMLKWREENADQYKAAKRRHYEANKEYSFKKAKEYAAANPEWKAAQCAKRRARKKRAIPKWVDLKKIQVLYEKASVYGFNVDHIVPLSSKRVCGLHCWENLQLLDPVLNAEKHNSYWPDM